MKEYKLPIGCDVPETIILADGDFPSHPLALEWLRQCPYVVCCDGAANTYIRSGRMSEAIVGDGDSLLPGIKERYASLIHSETEQETNDLSKAFRFCLSQERKLRDDLSGLFQKSAVGMYVHDHLPDVR